MQSDTQLHWKRTVVALVLFGVAFGYVEAAIVRYLGVLYETVRQRVHPGRSPDEVFPLLTFDQLQALSPEQGRLLGVEIAREAATIVMLVAIGIAVARNAGQWAAAFAIAFGTWDITYYAILKVLQNWPPSIMKWDLLFLIPVPWAAPVLAPVLVSASMITAGVWHLRRESLGHNIRLGLAHWSGLFLGATIIVVSFTLDCRNVMAGGIPQSFNWLVFGLGETIGILSYASGARSPHGSVKRTAMM
jgi:hypothetical protein